MVSVKTSTRALASRYLASDATTGGSDAAGARFLGQPFSFGGHISFERQQPAYLSDLQWHSLAYLDPGMAWSQAHAAAPPPQVKAKVVKHQPSRDGYSTNSVSSSQTAAALPAPAAVTITHTRATSASGQSTGSTTGMAVRERPASHYLVGGWDAPIAFELYEDQRTAAPAPAALQRSRSSTILARSFDDEAPGPGRYEAPPRDRGPAYTMRGRTAPTLEVRTGVPGPGQYDTAVPAGSGPAYTMRPRFSQPGVEGQEQPGPGQYDPVTGLNGPAFSMPGKLHDKVVDIPGPGAYDVAGTGDRGPAVTIAGRPREQRQVVLPGPADYQAEQRRIGPAITIGARHYAPDRQDVPAPGDYTVLPLVGREGPAYSLGARPPSPRPRSVSPGVGAYHVASTLGKDAPAFSMGERRVEDYEDGLPGPAEYFRPLGPGGPAYSLGARPAAVPPAVLLPGPGAYATDAAAGNAGPAYTFPGAPRTEADAPSSPGPGAYQPPDGPRGPAFTMPGKHAIADTDELLPAPGHYGVPTHPGLPSRPAFTMGVRPAEALPEGPGPNDYELPQDTWRQGPSYSMGARNADDAQRPLSPGPGQYEQPRPPQGPAFTLAGRPAPAGPAIGDGPAPGDYNTTAGGMGPAFTIGGRRDEPQRPPSPGPGEYHHQPAVCEGPAFTMAGRVAPPAPVSAVGPGTYDAEAQLPAAPAFTMPGRGRTEEIEESPGPGAYDGVAAKHPDGPAWSLGLRTEPLPGPGADAPPVGRYDVPVSFPAGPAFTMRRRPNEAPLEPSPGPGDHHVRDDPTAAAAPAFSIQGRRDDLPPEVTPGPGDYQMAPERGPAFSIAGRLKDVMVTADPDVPGPGLYVPPESDRGPAYSMRQRLAADQRDAKADVPGPGEYPTPAGPSGPAFTMRVKARAHAVGVEAAAIAAQGVPGPADYGVPSLVGAPSSPAFTMRNLLPAAKKEGPAPGDYGIPGGSAPAGPAYTLAGLRASSSHLQLPVPGPGEYHQAAVEQGGPAYTMGRKPKLSKRAMRAKKQGPAPGDYHHAPARRGPAFSIVPPHPAPAPFNTPAPGEYSGRDTATSLVQAAPAWTLQPRPAPATPNGVPGPGTYHDVSRHHFPRPLGSVVSSILKTRIRPDDGASAQVFTAVDYAQPEVRQSVRERDQQAGQGTVTGGTQRGMQHEGGGKGSGRRVVFTSETAFRDSQDAAGAAVRQAARNAGGRAAGGLRSSVGGTGRGAKGVGGASVTPVATSAAYAKRNGTVTSTSPWM